MAALVKTAVAGGMAGVEGTTEAVGSKDSVAVDSEVGMTGSGVSGFAGRVQAARVITANRIKDLRSSASG